VVDGLMVRVLNAVPGMLACVETANPAYRPLPDGQMDDAGRPFGGKNVWATPSCLDDANHNGRFLISHQRAFFEGDLGWSHDYEIRWTAEGSWASYGWSTMTWIKVPFELWDIGFGTPDDPSDDEQMVAILDEAGGTPDVWDIPNGGEVDEISGLPCSDGILFYYADGSPGGYRDISDACDSGNFEAANLMWNAVYNVAFMRIVVARDDGGTGDPGIGTVVRFLTNKPNRPGDAFTFSTAGFEPETGVDSAKEDVLKINVFPNPYFGANAEETRTLDHFVRFTHLPPRAILRIYTLSGELVRTLEHGNGTQFETWNLQNYADIPVASGMYVVHVDCGSLGQKVLKLALIMAEERLRQY
jgi:hypothetical protein